MKLIPLTKGKFAKVDDEDFEWLSQWKWQAKLKQGKKDWYAIRYKYAPVDRQTMVSMSRLIMKAPDGVLIDHWNGDTLDNQKGNLRPATQAQNQHNQRRLRKDNTSGKKGVYLNTRSGRYVAQIFVATKRQYIGTFDTAQQAADAYDLFACAMFGQFAAPNTVIR